MQQEDNLGLSIRRDKTGRERNGSGPGARRTPRRTSINEPKSRMTIRVPMDTYRLLTLAAAHQGRNLSDVCVDVLGPEADRLRQLYDIKLHD